MTVTHIVTKKEAISQARTKTLKADLGIQVWGNIVLCSVESVSSKPLATVKLSGTFERKEGVEHTKRT